MNSKLVFLLIPFLLLIACSRSVVVQTKVDDLGNKEEFEFNTKTQKKQGWYKKTNAEGHLMFKANYSDDMLEGLYEVYDERGVAFQFSTYHQDLLDGPFKELFPNSTQVCREGMFKNNLMVGEWRIYYPTGTLKEVLQYVEGKEDGPYKTYYPNGKIQAEGLYKHCVYEKFHFNNEDTDRFENGENKLYNENGELQSIRFCHCGICDSLIWKKE